MKIGIKTRPDRSDVIPLAKSIHDVLVANGHELSFGTLPENDMEIVIGGDGTILRAVSEMGKWQNPVLGINMGGVGFLADIEPDEAISYVKTITETTMLNVEERTRINVRNGEIKSIAVALNEVAILSNGVGKMTAFTIVIDGVEVQSFKADGLVVSTPTGSTAYAMSAGGSIVDPLIHDGYLVVPIAPYLLSSRPQLISTKRKLEIDIVSEDAFIVVDGLTMRRVNNEYPVEIQVDPNPAKFVNVNRNFFKKVGDKLGRM
jgi:NAD+ kinase